MKKRFNNLRTPFKAWPIAQVASLANSFTTTWLLLPVLLLPVPKQCEEVTFPALTDNFRIKFEERINVLNKTYSLVNLSAICVKNLELEQPALDSLFYTIKRRHWDLKTALRCLPAKQAGCDGRSRGEIGQEGQDETKKDEGKGKGQPRSNIVIQYL